MAGPSIVVRVLGDLKGLVTATDQAGTKAATAGGKLHSAFSGALASINKTGVLGPFGDQLDNLDQSLDQLGQHSKQTSDRLLGIGAVTTGIGVALTAFGSKEKAAHQQLQAAISATGHSYREFAGRIDSTIKSQEHFGHSSAETQDSLRLLTQATGSPTKALQLMSTASNLAANKHESLSAAAGQLGKAYNGAGKIFKEFGITVTKASTIEKAAESASKKAEAADKALYTAKHRLSDMEAIDASKKKLSVSAAIALRNAQQRVNAASLTAVAAHHNLTVAQNAARHATQTQHSAVDQLGKKLQGQASAQANTFTGHMKAMGTVIEDRVSQFGQKFGPAITAAGVAMTGLGAAMKAGSAIVQGGQAAFRASAAALGLMSAAEDASAASELAMLWPIALIVAALVGLIAIGYVIYRNWNTIWHGILVAVQFVWSWIKGNWPLLLGILFGPIGLAAALIGKYWRQILSGVQAVWNWIRGSWRAVIGWLTAPLLAAADIIRGAWNGLLGFFGGLPGRMAGIFSGMWHGITEAFRAAINAVIDIWNRLHFQLPAINFGPIHLGGTSIGVPSLPHLAQGGLITQSGLVFAHAGEAVSPIPNGALGPSVVIEGVTVQQPMDVALFMRAAAWEVRRQRI